MEILSPERRLSVAREDDVVCAFLVVPPVDQVEEEPRVLLVELAVPHLIYDETGGPDEAREHRRRFSRPPRSVEFIPELRRLNEVSLQAVFAALIAEGLRQMRLSRSGRTDERKIAVCIDGGQAYECSGASPNP